MTSPTVQRDVLAVAIEDDPIWFEVENLDDTGRRVMLKREVPELTLALQYASETPYANLTAFRMGWVMQTAYYSPKHPVSECRKFRL